MLLMFTPEYTAAAAYATLSTMLDVSIALDTAPPATGHSQMAGQHTANPRVHWTGALSENGGIHGCTAGTRHRCIKPVRR